MTKINKIPGLLAIVSLLASLLLLTAEPQTSLAALVTPGLESEADGNWHAPGQLLLKVKSGIDVSGLVDPAQAPAALQNLFNRLGVYKVKSLGSQTGVLLVYFGGSVDQAQSLAATDPAIEQADPNRLVKLADTGLTPPNDPLYQSGKQWWLDRIHAPEAWKITTGSKSIKVGIADDGIDASHPDLTGKVIAAYNFAEETAISHPSPEGHATSVAGCITANTNNASGLAGLNWDVSLIDGKGFGQQANGYTFDLVRSNIFAINQGARVVNNSWGGGSLDLATLALADYAASKNVVLVFSSGNSGTQIPAYPGSLSVAYPNIITVGGVDFNDKVVGFSNYGQQISVVAPASGIWTAEPGGGYRNINGTSFSAPIVTGVVALMLAANPNLTPIDVRNILEGTADDISGVGFTLKTGYGRVNAYKAVLAAKNNDLRPGKLSTVTGRVTGVDPTKVRLSLDPLPGSFRPDASGNFKLTNLGKGTYRLRAAVKGPGTGSGPAEFKLSGNSDTTLQFNFAFQNLKPASLSAEDNYVDQARFFDTLPASNTAAALYFQPTGHTLAGGFRHYWESHGGLAQFGYPLSEPFQEVSATDGKLYTVQYFERNRFEWHPENSGSDYEVLLGLLGQENLAGQVFPVQTAGSEGVWFKETGQNLSGSFRAYWQNHGGLAQFGYPLSPVIEENGYKVQYFERNRFELHPENAGSDYEVLLGLLGTRLARQRGYIF